MRVQKQFKLLSMLVSLASITEQNAGALSVAEANNRSAEEIQQMIQDGTLDAISAQGEEDMNMLLESNRSAKELQELAQSGAMDQLKEAQAGYRGAFEQLLESNRSNEEIQRIMNSGMLDQIDAQNEGAFEQLVQAGTLMNKSCKN